MMHDILASCTGPYADNDTAKHTAEHTDIHTAPPNRRGSPVQSVRAFSGFVPLMLWRAICALVLSAAGCSGSGQQPQTSLRAKAAEKSKADVASYERTCTRLNTDFTAKKQAGKYLPASLHVRQWAGADSAASKMLTEAELVKRLRKGGPRIILVMARGGLGKSTLSAALEAQTCATRAVVRVDLKWDIPVNTRKNPLLTIIETKLAGTQPKQPSTAARIEALLHGRDLLLFFDSLDEVSLTRRGTLVTWIEQAMAPIQGTTALIFTRPPVYSASYGFAHINARIEIPLLNCAATQRAQRELIGGDAALANFLEFSKTHGLDRQVKRADGTCWYPHMATYRDILVVRQIATNAAKSPPKAGSLLPSRARIYQYLVSISLIKDLGELDMMPTALMALVDRMTAAANPNGTERNIGFTVGGCLAQTRVKDEGKRKQVCERLMQSSLFKETGTVNTWQFRNQSLADLFLARGMHDALGKTANQNGKVRAGDTKGRAANCAAVAQHANLFESNEVAGFLVGMPRGQTCLLPIIQQLCNRSDDNDTTVALLDQGLPPGKARTVILHRVFDTAGDAAMGKSCLAQTLHALKATAPAGSLKRFDRSEKPVKPALKSKSSRSSRRRSMRSKPKRSKRK